METEPIDSQLLFEKTGTQTIESLSPGKLPLLICLFTQELKLHESIHLYFLHCRKQSPILITVQFASKGTSPMTLCGSCPAGESLGRLLLNEVCVEMRGPLGCTGSYLPGLALRGQAAQTFLGLNSKQWKKCSLSP